MRLCYLLLAVSLIAARAEAQFDIEDSHTTASLRGIHNVGRGVAWASGTNGTVLRTEDGGYLWQTCSMPPGAEKLDFRGVQGFDENTAIVMSSGTSDLSRLYKTSDGCETWKLIFTNPDKEGFWDAVRFESTFPQENPQGTGVLIGDPVNGKFVIYTTKNRGDSWRPWETDEKEQAYLRFHPANARKDESLFAASNSALVVLYPNHFFFVTGGKGGSHIFASEGHDPIDNGTTFKFSVTTLPFAATDTAGVFSIAEQRTGPYSANIMAVGGDYQKPDNVGSAVFLPFRAQSYFDLDLSSQKVIAAQTPPHGYRSSVAYDPQQKLWITVGPNGTDISRDDGKNWTPLTPSGYDAPDADKNWNALSLPFVVGPHGRIGRLRTITQNSEHPPAKK
jgi:photosystem II stability/assembly factor-like uncharacterized protein